MPEQVRTIPRADVLGVGVSAIDMRGALDAIEGWIRRREPNYVCVTNVHSVMECQRDETLRRIQNRAGLVTPDGMPLVWLSRLAGFRDVRRVSGPDLMLEVFRRSLPLGWRHLLYGGTPQTAERLMQRLSATFPGIEICGVESPPFRPLSESEAREEIERINAARPDIVWVGLGCPKQERWMASRAGHVRSVLIGVGAAFDFHAGTKRRAPRWMQTSGLEWLFRLASEPRRLIRRYAVTNTAFLAAVLRSVARGEFRQSGTAGEPS